MRIAIVSLRYFGDCLLAAALAKPLKEQCPDAEIAVLTFERNASIVNGIPYVDKVLTVPNKASLPLFLKTLWKIKNRFDWAIDTTHSTRSLVCSYFSAKNNITFAYSNNFKSFWKHLLITKEVSRGSSPHILDQFSNLLSPLLSAKPALYPLHPFQEPPEEISRLLAEKPYVVLHLSSQFEDKDWNIEYWAALSQLIAQRSEHAIVFTGGASQKEQEKIKRVCQSAGLPSRRAINLAGKLTFGQTAAVIQHASAYVGIDTATSHVAAATGTPTIVLFGRTPPSGWGPAPKTGSRQWNDHSACQKSGNVCILKNPAFLDCQQCQSGHINSCPKSKNARFAECLQTLPVQCVWAAASDYLTK